MKLKNEIRFPVKEETIILVVYFKFLEYCEICTFIRRWLFVLLF